VGDECTVIGKEKVTCDSRLDFSRCLQAPQVKHVVVDVVTNRDTDIRVLECHVQHNGEEDDKKQWSQTTALLRAVRDFEVWRYLTILDDTCPHAFMERAYDFIFPYFFRFFRFWAVR